MNGYGETYLDSTSSLRLCVLRSLRAGDRHGGNMLAQRWDGEECDQRRKEVGEC